MKLSPSPDQRDHKKSQGIPNTVEQLRLTPDGNQDMGSAFVDEYRHADSI